MVDVCVLDDVDQGDGWLHVLLNFQDSLALLVVCPFKATIVAGVHGLVFMGVVIHGELYYRQDDEEGAECG